MNTITIAGLVLEFADLPATTAPDAPPLVLLHEGLGCVAMWRRFPEKLAAATGRRVIAWSRAGYGASEPYPTPRTPRYLHDEALTALPAFLAAMRIERPVLIGHSDGASIALIFAGAFPEEVDRIIVMAPHEFVEPETLAGIRGAVEAWNTTDFPRRLAVYHRDAATVFATWSSTWLNPDFHAWNIEEFLPAIRCPVLAIQGVDDEYATLHQIEVIAEKTPGARLLKLANCGHSPHKDQPEVVVAAIAGFIETPPA
ncbi:MAG: alpha/beta fold hydrolase [Betaproteobacteria bacterium]